MKKIITYLLVVALFAFFGTALHNLNVRDQKLDLKSIELQDTGAKIKTLETNYEDLNKQLNHELEQKQKNSEKIKQLEQDRQKLEQEKIELQKQLQAKAAERARLAAASGRVSAASASPADHQALLAAAGIPESDWWAAEFIIGRESGWNPCAYNPGQSDCNYQGERACGIPQALPCSKLRNVCPMTDAVCQLKWQYDYVRNRYGGYSSAYNHWVANHWY